MHHREIVCVLWAWLGSALACTLLAAASHHQAEPLGETLMGYLLPVFDLWTHERTPPSFAPLGTWAITGNRVFFMLCLYSMFVGGLCAVSGIALRWRGLISPWVGGVVVLGLCCIVYSLQLLSWTSHARN